MGRCGLRGSGRWDYGLGREKGSVFIRAWVRLAGSTCASERASDRFSPSSTAQAPKPPPFPLLSCEKHIRTRVKKKAGAQLDPSATTKTTEWHDANPSHQPTPRLRSAGYAAHVYENGIRATDQGLRAGRGEAGKEGRREGDES